MFYLRLYLAVTCLLLEVELVVRDTRRMMPPMMPPILTPFPRRDAGRRECVGAVRRPSGHSGGRPGRPRGSLVATRGSGTGGRVTSVSTYGMCFDS